MRCRYSEVRQALFTNPYQKIGGAEDAAPLPLYEVTVGRLRKGSLPFGKPWRFLQAVERTVDPEADLRWGGDGKDFRRLLHPNVVCLAGWWEINEEIDYSGYFKKAALY
ncbi:conserved hypothetical protein [Candidatus Methylobacter favarea]|uniref:Uncharacterized protein n=2 Tax=Candidatus Methylobacter favarea TaxID=2707345 RepID=A0A8S0Y5X2_9GAMM|nr:conserved hypothetical protein [Candidatus Methylobacter favarea]